MLCTFGICLDRSVGVWANETGRRLNGTLEVFGWVRCRAQSTDQNKNKIAKNGEKGAKARAIEKRESDQNKVIDFGRFCCNAVGTVCMYECVRV